MKTKMTRRSFLRTAGAAAALFTIVPRHVLGGPGFTPPSEQLTKAVIGVGGMGTGHLSLGVSKLLAVCDVDEKHVKAAVGRGGKDVKGYRDFREVLARPDIDVVHIATPPHWHGLISFMAAQAGKDIWCEKPMTRTIGEGKKVVEAVNRCGRIFRVNTWFRFQSAFYGFGTTVEPLKKAVMNGLLGWPIKATVGGTTGFDWKFGWSGRTDLKPVPVPAELDYDYWLGPAPYKPYHPHRVHGNFRGYWDYDAGGLGDMGMHYLDPVQYILGKDDTSPVEVEVDAPPQHPDAASSWRRITMKYADGCQIILDGDNREKDAPFLEGPNGKIYQKMRSSIPNLQQHLKELPDPAPQATDFEDCVRRRRKFALNEMNAHRSCTLVNMASSAVRLGRSLKYDPVAQLFVGDEEANRLVNQPMRAPWHM